MDNQTKESGILVGETGTQCKKQDPSMGTHLIKLAWRCVPNWLRHQVLPYRADYNLRRHAPLYCGLYVTFRCNLTCSWCVNPPLPEGLCMDDYEADVESVSRLLDHPFFKSVAHINLTGGEPLINKHIGELIHLIRRRGFLVGMVTNGMLLEDKVDELLEAGISDIRVSMYHNTVDRLATVLPKLRGRLPVATSYIILNSELHKNPDAIVKAVQVSRDSGAVGTRLNFYMPAGQCGDGELVYEDDPELAILKTRLAKEFPDYPVYWRTAVQRNIKSSRDKTCRQPWETFHVDARGNLGLCCRYCFPDGKNGNLFEQPLPDLLNSKRLNGLRAGILAKGPVIPVDCTNCLYLGGGKAARKVLDSPLPTLIKKKLAARKTAPAASSES